MAPGHRTESIEARTGGHLVSASVMRELARRILAGWPGSTVGDELSSR